MKIKQHFLLSLIILISAFCKAQFITVDDTFSAADLVTQKLLKTSCASVENITSAGGDFAVSTNKSFGFFTKGISDFPFENGILLTSSRAVKSIGPNLGDLSEGSTNWQGDTDLEVALGTSQTFNATKIEFDFTPLIPTFSFNYIFASEEYALSYPCFYSDGFAFLLKPANDPAAPYENLALIPNTSTPVSSTSIRPLINGGSQQGCPASNEIFFNGYNNNQSAINYNGQTKVMTAKATVIPGVKYHIKLVIADQDDTRFDSAIFIEGGSFDLGLNLGGDRTLQGGNPICGNQSFDLDATIAGQNTYKWYRNNVQIQNATQPIYSVSETGIYKVEVSLGNSTCVFESEVKIDFAPAFSVTPKTIKQCDTDLDMIANINLKQVEPDVIVNPSEYVFKYYTNQIAAETQNDTFLITNPSSYQAANGSEVWLFVKSTFGCTAVLKVSIVVSATQLPPNYSQTINMCDDFVDASNNDMDGISTFDFTATNNALVAILPSVSNYAIKYYRTKVDFDSETDTAGNSLAITNTANYRNIGFPNNQTIWIKVLSTLDNSCFGFGQLFLNVQPIPKATSSSPTYICANTTDEKNIFSGLDIGENPLNYAFKWFKNNVEIIGQNFEMLAVSEAGMYSCEISNLLTNCKTTTLQEVKPIEKPQNITLTITDLVENNSVKATVQGTGTFEYAIDFPAGHFQDSPFFENVQPGFHIFFARNKLGCEPISKSFAIVGIMSFFTPNNDSFNDYWKIKGIGKDSNLKSKVQIFDRFSKLIIEIPSGASQGWDGTFNGTPLPTDDYWFTLTLEDGRTASGHFSLKR